MEYFSIGQVMIDIWDPIDLSDGFDAERAARLQKQAGEHGIRLVARWLQRSRLVTSQVENLEFPISQAVLCDYKAMTLYMAPSTKVFGFWNAILAFSREIRRRAMADHQEYERVADARNKVHLIQPHRSIAACGSRGSWGLVSTSPLTCKTCIKAALDNVRRTPDPLERVVLLESELKLVGECGAPIVPNGSSVSVSTPEPQAAAG